MQSCLAEDPDLAVLEDDALDLYSQTVTPDPPPKPLPTISGAFGGFRGGGSVKQKNSFAAGFASPAHLPPPPPLRAVQYRHCPVPCFYGVGLVRPPPYGTPPPAPTPSASMPMQMRPDSGPSAAAAAGAVPSTFALPGHVTESVGPSDRDNFLDPAAIFHQALGVTAETTRTTVRCRDGGSGCWRDANVAGAEGAKKHGGMASSVPVGGRNGRRQRPWAGGGRGCDEGFKALVEAFSRRGRPDVGVEDLRMQRLLGKGHQQLAALDDIHASLRDPESYRDAFRGGSGGGSGLQVKNCFCNGLNESGENGGREGVVGVTGKNCDDGVLSTVAASSEQGEREVEQESGVEAKQQQQQQRQQFEEGEQENEDQSSKTLNNNGTYRQRNPPPPPEEIGIRTSMSKGNRWIIGRRVTPGQGGGGGELLAIIEAPILSVGDARAAVKRRFVGAGGGGSGGDDGKVEGVGSHAAAGKSSGRTLTSRLR